ncbi:WD40 repeat domain-containing protein [Fulvivirga sedimenti]|uniref:WD40 repeat domain-containing protein n=1 Tax=Fulvivirga sedimenti TaxID=2879465 RepID=A0A9X1HLL8_9BACT|nr:WD40 repeat domain-containing protein [Fulvivirga sedimenti]MCA6074151.1 WD40 repeat domain-containing protein [Fulvivirga sedimenti]
MQIFSTETQGMINVTKKATMSGHTDCVYSLADCPEESSFFSAAGDGMVVKWNLNEPDSGKLVARVPNSVYSIAYHESSELLCVGHNYEGVHFIDWQNQKEIGNIKCTEGAIFALRPYKNMLLVGDSSGAVHMLDVEKRSVLASVKYSDKSARSIDVDPVNRQVAVGYSDHSIRILDLATLDLVSTITDHNNSVFSVRYNPDFQYLLSAGRDARIIIRENERDYVQVENIIGHMFAINNIEFSPDGKHFVTCSMDKSIKVWDSDRFKLLKVIDKARHAGHGTSVNKLLWMDYENTLISASDDRTISAWDIKF